jgi:hypothetical protein
MKDSGEEVKYESPGPIPMGLENWSLCSDHHV